MRADHAKQLAEEFSLLLCESGLVELCQIAGSIRRGDPQPSDIEIVIQPFADGGTGKTLDLWIQGAIDDPDTPLAWDETLKRRGPRYKRFLWRDEPLDLFIVLPPAQWGVVLAVRTGPTDYIRMLTTPRNYHGMLPPGIKQQESALWALKNGQRSLIETPDEAGYFRALGLPLVPPNERTVANLQKYRELEPC